MIVNRNYKIGGHRFEVMGKNLCDAVSRIEGFRPLRVGKVHEIVRPSGRTVAVTDWHWRLASRLWRGLGVLRTPCLRMLRFLVR